MWPGQQKWTKWAHKIWPYFSNLWRHNLCNSYTSSYFEISTLNLQFNKQVEIYRTQIHHVAVKIFLILWLGVLCAHLVHFCWPGHIYCYYIISNSAWNATFGTCFVQRESSNMHITMYQLLCMIHLTALLECIDLFILDVVNIFQNEYCTSNKDLQNILEVETHLTLAVTLWYCMMMNDE